MPFSKFALGPNLLKAIKEAGFHRPTPVQEQAIPPAVAGRDVMAIASTGSGKTAAFVLPILSRLMPKPRGVTRALILTPTRELAAQIQEHLEELAVHTPVTGAAVYGGVGMAPQEHAFRSGVDVIVATPGRLLDHLRRPYAAFKNLEVLVLDEADRMLDMGFLPDVRRILKELPAKRQTLFFSATMPQEISGLAREMLRDPVTIHLEKKSAPAAGISHAVYPVGHDRKSGLLAELLKRNLVADAIVFTRTKHRANRLADFLERHGVATGRIHGNRSQGQRTAALQGFKSGQYRILVATDIVARGIDVEDLGHVINFDVPADPDSYIHRVGRTARAEATGDAFTFVAPDEEPDLRQIERALGKSLPRVMIPDFDYSKKMGEKLEIPIHERLAAHRAAKRGKPHAASGGGSHARRGSTPSHGGGGSGSARGSSAPRGRHSHAAGRSHGSGHPGGHSRGHGGGQDPGARLDAIMNRIAPLSGGAGSKPRPPGLRGRGRR